MSARKTKGLNKPNDFICKTIVTSDLIDVFAEKQGITCLNVLTGFKWIAEKIRENEGSLHFICGGEESYGYMIGDQTRDKDAISAVALICEMAAVAKNSGKTLFDELTDIYLQYGFYKERLVSVTKKGMHGAEEIAAMMQKFRDNPPKTINGFAVIELLDYKTGKAKNLKTGAVTDITLPSSNVLQFKLEDGSKISARPSGTEPKIKLYFSVNAPLKSKDDFDKVNHLLDGRIDAIIGEMSLS